MAFPVESVIHLGDLLQRDERDLSRLAVIGNRLRAARAGALEPRDDLASVFERQLEFTIRFDVGNLVEVDDEFVGVVGLDAQVVAPNSVHLAGETVAVLHHHDICHRLPSRGCNEYRRQRQHMNAHQLSPFF
jgi:hypothetical protein